VSASSIYRAANDPDLIHRVTALANKEIQANDELAVTVYGKQLVAGMANISVLMWPVAASTEAAYESALLSGVRGAPGYDSDVITDASITAAIVAGWPPDEAFGIVPPAVITPPTPLPTPPTATWTTGATGTLFVQVDITHGTPSVNYTVEWGDGGGPGLITLDANGVGVAAHNYAAAGTYQVHVNDENGNVVSGSSTTLSPS
jgi:hypothetical protein